MSKQKKAGPVDFAISYAGEDLAQVRPLAEGLRELGFDVFLADEQRLHLVGLDGERFLDRLFTEAKVVIAFISRHYREKDWPRFEWDVIRKRNAKERFIPIRLDDTPILGLPSSFFFLEWSGTNLSEMVEACVKRLLLYEKSKGIKRSSLYDSILDEIKYGSKGATSKAFQLVKDNRQRAPLADAEMPEAPWSREPSYTIADAEWHNYSKVKRRSVKIRLPSGLNRDEVIFNLKHCCIKEFNDLKPDAVSVCAYHQETPLLGIADIGIVEFAPFGEWGKAEEGVAYNLPTSEFEFRILWARAS